jgi:CubicO group peptidase (beta-lactamase class C family)
MRQRACRRSTLQAELHLARTKSSDARFVALSDAVRDAMERYHVPGVALGVIHEGDEQLAGFGVTRVDRPLPIGLQTLFPVASITKTVVATAIMRLVEQGQLDLDEPVCRYLPELRLADPVTTEQLTLAHLLTHTAGVQGDVADGAHGIRCGSESDALARFVPMFAHLPQHALPGALWTYNNAGFSLAGRVIEVVAGKPFEMAIRHLVLEPLGMTHSFFSPPESLDETVAAGHRFMHGRAEVDRGPGIPRFLGPAGGLVCPATDLLCYARFHLNDGTIDPLCDVQIDRTTDGTADRSAPRRLLSTASMALMHAPRISDALHNGCLASFADEIGLSWFSRATDRGRVLVHGGWTSLAHRLTLVPERHLAIFVLTNANTGHQLTAEITKKALHDYLEITGLDVTLLRGSTADLTEFAGTYRVQDPDEETLSVEVTPDGLHLSEMGPAAFYAPDHIAIFQGVWRHERGEFLRARSGRITYLRLGGALWQRAAPGAAAESQMASPAE